MLDQNKLYSLAFTLIVLFSVLVGGVRRGSSDDSTLEARTETTSFAATAESTVQPQPALVAEPSPESVVSAAGALVKYLGDPTAIFSLNPGEQWPLASLTKLMTAVVTQENIPEDAKIQVSANAVATEGGAGNLVVGKVYSRGELLDVLLKVSSNDAAVALMEYLGKDKFLDLMNEKVVELGMYNTRYFDPSGLSPLNQSMASDLEKLVVYIFKRHPEIFAITREPEGNIHPFVKWTNFIGGKTGFIDEASGNLISLFNYNGRPLLVIVLGSEDRAKDTETLYDRYAKP